jgi:hypothetical protein
VNGATIATAKLKVEMGSRKQSRRPGRRKVDDLVIVDIPVDEAEIFQVRRVTILGYLYTALTQ